MKAIAAAPRYLGTNFEDAPPGHRFGLYFEFWSPDGFRRVADQDKGAALKRLRGLPESARALLDALLARRRAQAEARPDHSFVRYARSSAPFITGIGMEHPLENGFAFANPYGLPVLPGASVKGVLRAAAEELALELHGASHGWDPLALWWLFGFDSGAAYLAAVQAAAPDVLVAEGERRRAKYLAWLESAKLLEAKVAPLIDEAIAKSEDREAWHAEPKAFLRALAGVGEGESARVAGAFHWRGALAFHDVLVRPAQGALGLDILTPHYSHYYQGSEPPHDAGQPTPNVFLIVPPESEFGFQVDCVAPRLPAELRSRWRELLESAFNHAFDWLGFGAKTALGYGQMSRDDTRQKAESEERSRRREAERVAALPEEARKLDELRRFYTQQKESGRPDRVTVELRGRLAALLEEAETWPHAARLELTALATEIYGFVGWGKGKKKNQRRAVLAALRDQPKT